MTGPDVAPNYPQSAPPSLTLQVTVVEESHWMHKTFQDISAHHYLMVMGLSCLQMGARPDGSPEDLLLQPMVFQTDKGAEITTGNFGVIRFPEDFERVGKL